MCVCSCLHIHLVIMTHVCGAHATLNRHTHSVRALQESEEVSYQCLAAVGSSKSLRVQHTELSASHTHTHTHTHTEICVSLNQINSTNVADLAQKQAMSVTAACHA